MEPRSIGELIQAVLAVGRLQGPIAAAEEWCGAAKDNWDVGAMRTHLRLLRRAATDTVDEKIVEYVSEYATLQFKLAERGTRLGTPQDLEAALRGAFARNPARDRVGHVGMVSQPPSSLNKPTKDEYARQLIAARHLLGDKKP